MRARQVYGLHAVALTPLHYGQLARCSQGFLCIRVLRGTSPPYHGRRADAKIKRKSARNRAARATFTETSRLENTARLVSHQLCCFWSLASSETGRSTREKRIHTPGLDENAESKTLLRKASAHPNLAFLYFRVCALFGNFNSSKFDTSERYRYLFAYIDTARV